MEWFWAIFFGCYSLIATITLILLYQKKQKNNVTDKQIIIERIRVIDEEIEAQTEPSDYMFKLLKEKQQLKEKLNEIK